MPRGSIRAFVMSGGLIVFLVACSFVVGFSFLGALLFQLLTLGAWCQLIFAAATVEVSKLQWLFRTALTLVALIMGMLVLLIGIIF
jgi:hypothetical protein